MPVEFGGIKTRGTPFSVMAHLRKNIVEKLKTTLWLTLI
jgi:hypothetical protein